MSKSDNNKQPSARSKAVALRYRVEDDMAPVVIASGYGSIADNIIGIAEEKGIPVFKDDSTASMLCMLEVGRNIPPELYEVVAAIYMQIMTVSHQIKHSDEPAPNAPRNVDDLRRRLSSTRRDGRQSNR